MLGLQLEELKIYSDTSKGRFSTTIGFKPGLNIISADNTSGKSTCINAIAYALGLEAILGPSRRRPFPKSMYSYILKSKEDNTHYKVLSSAVELSLHNHQGKRVRLIRDVLGDEKKVSVISETNEKQDYFLGAAGDIGSAKSSLGFHYWLEGFLGWQLPKVITYEGRETPLYLECIFPLYFIEQKRGWSEIQANTPSYYKIKNVKSSAAEFVLGLEDYTERNKIALLRKNIDELQGEWDKNITAAFSTAELNSIQIKAATKLSDSFNPETIGYTFTSGRLELSAEQRLRALKARLNELEKPLTRASEPLTEKAKELFQLNKDISNSELEIEALIDVEIKTTSKLRTIENDLDRYKQLKRLKDVGSELLLPVETRSCPICDSDIHESLIASTSSARPLTLEQNIDYLKNQKDFYEKIVTHQNSKLAALKLKFNAQSEIQKDLNHQVLLLRNENANLNQSEVTLIREKIEIEHLIRDTDRIFAQQLKLNARAKSIHDDWSQSKSSLELAKRRATKSISTEILDSLEQTLKSNLSRFGYNSSDMTAIKISRITYRPELDGFDIVADSSASDYIRIIWSYSLALLELASQFAQVKHSGFVVFDEPRQHEANRKDFCSLIKDAANATSFGGQVIIATSIDLSEILGPIDYTTINIMKYDDYILQHEH